MRGAAGAAVAAAGSAIAALAILGTCAIAEARAAGADGEGAAAVYETPAEGSLTARPQADGPLYDAPLDIEQSVVCDRENRMYILLESPEGGIAITPYLDEDGEQRVMPRP